MNPAFYISYIYKTKEIIKGNNHAVPDEISGKEFFACLK